MPGPNSNPWARNHLGQEVRGKSKLKARGLQSGEGRAQQDKDAYARQQQAAEQARLEALSIPQQKSDKETVKDEQFKVTREAGLIVAEGLA